MIYKHLTISQSLIEKLDFRQAHIIYLGLQKLLALFLTKMQKFEHKSLPLKEINSILLDHICFTPLPPKCLGMDLEKVFF